LSDFERPLNERGRRTAPFMGELMLANDYQPAVVLSSPAARAQETALLVSKSAKFAVKIRLEERIYEASPQGLRQVVAELDDNFASAMLVGHNPGIEGFIRFLTGQLEPMPTAALAVIDLKIDDWNAIDEGCGTLTAIYRPKDEIAKATA